MTFKVEYSAGFGNFSQNHMGFGPTIYIEEIINYESNKDYFDYVDFFLKYSKKDDTFFQIKLLEDRELSENEKLSKKKYLMLRDAMCEWAKNNTQDEEVELEKNYHQGD